MFMSIGCVTRQQARLGYVVPSSDLNGEMVQYKKCGAILAWMFLLDDDLLDKALKQAEAEGVTTGGKMIRVDVNIPSSCYIVRYFRPAK